MLVAYIQVIKDMCEGVVTRVRTFGGDTNDFPIDIRLHQGSTLSPFLFACVMDELPKESKIRYHNVCYLWIISFLSMRLVIE